MGHGRFTTKPRQDNIIIEEASARPLRILRIKLVSNIVHSQAYDWLQRAPLTFQYSESAPK